MHESGMKLKRYLVERGPCAECGTTTTSEWRKTDGIELCNACGLRARARKRGVPAAKEKRHLQGASEQKKKEYAEKMLMGRMEQEKRKRERRERERLGLPALPLLRHTRGANPRARSWGAAEPKTTKSSPMPALLHAVEGLTAESEERTESDEALQKKATPWPLDLLNLAFGAKVGGEDPGKTKKKKKKRQQPQEEQQHYKKAETPVAGEAPGEDEEIAEFLAKIGGGAGSQKRPTGGTIDAERPGKRRKETAPERLAPSTDFPGQSGQPGAAPKLAPAPVQEQAAGRRRQTPKRATRPSKRLGSPGSSAEAGVNTPLRFLAGAAGPEP